MAAPPPTLPSIAATPGAILAGRYRVERVVGQGGMGLVIEARHMRLDERVAMKFLLPSYAAQPGAAQRFLREARAAVKIKSEHVARVLDVGELDDGTPYMTMEYLEGSDLAALLRSHGVLPIVEAVDYVVQAGDAIAEAHGYGIIHRDLKPANLFLTRRPDGTPLVKVLDFGISKMVGEGVEVLTSTTAAIGSALYMSPEQMQQTRNVDVRTDIYALGITLFELLAGTQPFTADALPQLCARVLTGHPTPLRALRPDVPDHLAYVVARAYARAREERYASVSELVLALAPYGLPRSQPLVERIARLAAIVASGTGPRAMGGAVASSQPAASATPGHAGVGAPARGALAAAAATPPPDQPITGNTKTGLARTDGGRVRRGAAPAIAGILMFAAFMGAIGFVGLRWWRHRTASAEAGDVAPVPAASPPQSAERVAAPSADNRPEPAAAPIQTGTSASASATAPPPAPSAVHSATRAPSDGPPASKSGAPRVGRPSDERERER